MVSIRIVTSHTQEGVKKVPEQGKIEKKTEWKKVIDHPDLEIYWPSKVTVVGFFAAWLIVALIILGTMFLARIGA